MELRLKICALMKDGFSKDSSKKEKDVCFERSRDSGTKAGKLKPEKIHSVPLIRAKLIEF